MARRDPERLYKLRVAVRYLLERQSLANGHQARLARHFDVSRQRVHQVVVEERERRLRPARVPERQGPPNGAPPERVFRPRAS